jgi:hypothetical protein
MTSGLYHSVSRVQDYLKVISERLKPLLQRYISAEQLGFLKGRRIQDAIATAHECLHSIKQKNLKALVLKLDIHKAFDHIDWDFLRLILFSVGFEEKFSNWILSCVTNANIGVLINGEPSNFFKSERGLRQGCPLSPFLFILIMQGLSQLLAKRVEEQQLTNLVVYWMSLERIPAKIILILRRLSINFLWNDKVGNRRFHLCIGKSCPASYSRGLRFSLSSILHSWLAPFGEHSL